MNDEGKLFADKLGALIKKEGIGQVAAHERMAAAAKELTRIHDDAKYAKCMGIEFDTFKKRLQGKNVKRSARTMAEIAAYCFEPDGISAEHLVDPSLPLADFEAKLGLYVGERLEIPKDSITLAYDSGDERLKSSTLKETADKEKIAKYGQFARYHFTYCLILPRFSGHVVKQS